MVSASKSHSHPSKLPLIAVAIATVALLVLGTASDASAASAKTADEGPLGGLTSQGLPSYVQASHRGEKIEVAVLAIAVDCSDGGALIFPQVWRAVPIAHSGTFKVTHNDAFVEGGVSVAISETFSGAFNPERTKAVTKARTIVTFHQSDGSVDRCDSHSVKLHAQA